MSAISRVQLRHAGVDQHARIGMVDDVDVDRHQFALDEQVGNVDRRDGDRGGVGHCVTTVAVVGALPVMMASYALRIPVSRQLNERRRGIPHHTAPISGQTARGCPVRCFGTALPQSRDRATVPSDSDNPFCRRPVGASRSPGTPFAQGAPHACHDAAQPHHRVRRRRPFHPPHVSVDAGRLPVATGRPLSTCGIKYDLGAELARGELTRPASHEQYYRDELTAIRDQCSVRSGPVRIEVDKVTG